MFRAPFLAVAASLLPLLAAQDEAAPAPPKADAVLLRMRGTRAVFVRMRDQLFPDAAAYPAFCAEHATTPRSTLRAQTLKDLKHRADTSFAAVHDTVSKLSDSGDIHDLQRFWIINGFACDADAAAVKTLCALDAVAFVHLQTQPGQPQNHHRARDEEWIEARRKDQEHALKRIDARGEEAAFDVEAAEVPWNLERIRAHEAWKLGALGQGVVVAVLDTGIVPAPALLDALWRNPEEKPDGKDDDGNGYVDDLFGWDFLGETPYVVGDGDKSHGSMCSGINAGRPLPTMHTVTGVAPRARLMVMRGTDSLRAYEYAASMGADVMSLSYMWIEQELGSYRGVFRTAHEHLAACGVVAVGGAGNFGISSPEGHQIAIPKDIPCVIAAAGIEKDGKAPRASSRGPCTWNDVPFFLDYPPEHPLEKPDVTGCFGGFPVWHWTSFPGQRRIEVAYDGGDGTGLIVGPRGNSFSGPHAAGVAALMLSANHELTPWRVKELMERSCEDLGESGRDRVYGAGLLRADAAVVAAREAKIE